jgi:hypothetical protein
LQLNPIFASIGLWSILGTVKNLSLQIEEVEAFGDGKLFRLNSRMAVFILTQESLACQDLDYSMQHKTQLQNMVEMFHFIVRALYYVLQSRPP